MSIARLLADYRDGSSDPAQVIARAYERARSASQPAWISLVAWNRVKASLARLRHASTDLPLYGIPFAIKDNIDLAREQTTAACPAFAYAPRDSAFVVARLMAAGAIPIGKTNMDQFATGLTGTRTPYGACASVADARYVSGGSSSGSAVVVADGTVPFALATDTAGSGRVPAALNGIVGFKATLGAIGTRGVLPACRSLDCVSLLTTSVDDARRLLGVAAGFDAADPYSRVVAARPAVAPAGARIAVPRPDALTFCGDRFAAAAWQRALSRTQALGWQVVEIDFEPFAEAGRLLYDGPWISERYATIGQFMADNRRDVDSVVRRVVMTGRDHSAVDAFRAAHRLAELRLRTRAVWDRVDALLLPTTPTAFTTAEVADEPIVRNALLGTYTTFVNLLDLCAIAVPGGTREDGLPFGVSLIAPAGADRTLLGLAAHWGAEELPAAAAGDDMIRLAVVGAHLSGEPLNHQLVGLGGRFVETVAAAPGYRLFALPDTEPAKPGMVAGGPLDGPGIELEVWELPAQGFGRLVAGVPPPLVIGTVVLDDGRAVKGFLCDAGAVTGARDITAFGGWRAYRASLGLAGTGAVG
ncbi:MAG TPA: allophanate hydrolase [Solirubrobacteraceae bacterium]|nr:allophanate hydrolase [Solirubrobacteraceae bacterium]